ncbi:hypothetical protein SDC9_152882 [bioreactor metagenome]|uniref:Uncharacterized protein n=1 Tax=bioreactor metagenome TaxID=1076179 RepID=A0A645EUC9_9ZZZZ
MEHDDIRALSSLYSSTDQLIIVVIRLSDMLDGKTGIILHDQIINFLHRRLHALNITIFEIPDSDYRSPVGLRSPLLLGSSRPEH